MRALLLSTVALAAISSTAFAADLPSRATAPVAPVYAPVFTWSGLYVGLNAGVGWASDTNVYVTDSRFGSTSLSVGTDAGFVGGGQIGYNFQTGAFVFGVETDIQYADLSAKANWSGYQYSFSNGGSQYFGTVRARVGYAFDRVLVYVTGGLAYGGLNDNWWGGNNTQTGWTLGGGVEYAFTNNWTAKIEGLYVDLGSGSHSEFVRYGAGLTAGTATVSSGSSQGGGLVRVGVNYKF
jgi:outer membrane immunogenic protein